MLDSQDWILVHQQTSHQMGRDGEMLLANNNWCLPALVLSSAS